jgi:DNA-binding FrmR family transcriptional regulator
MAEEKSPQHQHDRTAVLNRLSRIEGHVGAVKRMVAEDISCPDILVQIAAVRSALNSVGRIILEDHIRNCMMDASQNGDFEEAMKSLKTSLDRFVD